MITSVTEDRLVITSDVHLGNLLFRSRKPFLDFLGRVASEGCSVCINGDGIDLAQLSLIGLSRDLGKLADVLRRFSAEGLRVHYVVGNHDIVLEHFLHDWGGINVVPFLNVQSGDTRVRVEHGHLYDTMFVKHPGLYHALTVFGGWCLWFNPRAYHGLKKLNDVFIRLRSGRPEEEAASDAPPARIPGEHPSFLGAAREISARGFDAVVFGHTHLAGHVALPGGASYFNTGSWFFEPHYVELREGAVRFFPVDS